LAGEHTRGGRCGLIGFNAGHLTSADSRMRVSLKGLPDKLRGGRAISRFVSGIAPLSMRRKSQSYWK